MAVDAITQFLRGRMALPASNVDFSTKINGAQSTIDDAGNATSLFVNGGNPPKIASGKLIAQPTSNGTYASYFQTPLGADGTRVGCEFTVAANDGGVTSVVLALWDHAYAGVSVPESRGHVVITPGTAQWIYYVFDSLSHSCVVNSGNFVAPAYDGTTVWRVDVVIDPATKDAYLALPDGSIAVVTHQKVAGAIAGTAGWSSGTTLTSLSGKYAMLEFFATAGSLTNINAFPKVTSFWADTTPAPALDRHPSVDALTKALVVSVGDPQFTAATLINSWTSPDPALPGYRHLGNGQVELRGYLTGGSFGTVAFILPPAYRPLTFQGRVVLNGDNTPGSALIDSASGTVTIYSGSGSCWLSVIYDLTP